MSKKHLGNNLLYLISEKKTLKWNDFKKYVEALYGGKAQEKDKHFIYNLSRNLSSLGYIDIGEKNNQTYIKVTPPMLVVLPYLTPVFLLTGACAPELLKTIKSHFQTEITSSKCLPATVMIKSENREDLEGHLQKIVFQGNKLSDYIKFCKVPIAWNVLEFSGSLGEYKKSLGLDREWCSGNLSDIKEMFDINDLKFKPNPSKIQNEISLVKVQYYGHFYKYYLFSKQQEKKVKVNLDWGRFLMAKKCQRQILSYNQKAFELTSLLRLPAILERGLALLSGTYPEFPYEKKNKNHREGNSGKKKKENKLFVFKNVPDKIARLVAEKLGQNLKLFAERR